MHIFLFINIVLNSFGKMPLGVFSENPYEFDPFSQYIHIDRDESLYETQYCLGHVTFGLQESFLLKPNSPHIQHRATCIPTNQ